MVTLYMFFFSDLSSYVLSSLLPAGSMASSPLAEQCPECGWAAVAGEEMSCLESLNDQTAEVSSETSKSEAVPNDPDADVIADEKDSDSNQEGMNAMARVERFQKMMVDLSSLPHDDPFWLETFHRITEEISQASDSVNDMARLKINLVSGCSGMLAEGWVLKAGHSKKRENKIIRLVNIAIAQDS